ncbi:MAG TPA: hypothetical protein VMV18_11050, partial [bacterium]|nr:hypothetical protein [bacterium]
ANDWAPDDAGVHAMSAGASTAAHTVAALRLEPGYGVCFAGAREWVRIRRGATMTIDASGFVWNARRGSVAAR